MKPTKIIFDTDPGVDDAMALLFIEAAPALDLVGITTVFGNGGVETTTRNALYLKHRFGLAAPVAKGADRPLSGLEVADAGHVHGENGLGGVVIPPAIPGELDPRPAHRFIIDTVRAHPGEITLLAVGRMTNLALALREDPEIASLVERVVIMGGAFGFAGHSGNVTPVAEANIAGDPQAADEIFGAAWEVVVIGLDVTQETLMTTAYLAALRDEGGEAGRFIWEISRFYEAFYRDATGAEGVFGHDFSAAAYIVAPQLFALRGGPIRVVTEGIAEGQTIQQSELRKFAPNAWSGRPSHRIATAVDAERSLALFRDTIVARYGRG
ncbi:nucleoside hydrolase [Prosthecomicrobium pneumaticum]|uniref:Inosine-uridine nucleoside N-ribohydrolase n=1 Tax=Prosthecomicrobium pneumaticum TaxID=81895 RepID=A0A7W9L396_9HYPH|nr:nucleoside hydrolase [Prosthecomicrobium pneumaticum]MBB5754295.1 inosine-uridine nucleoside N-ribohydrolase [Prosthecomicrobium pneumaticum]